MTITTKFNVGDEAFFLHDNEVKSANVVEINITIVRDSVSYEQEYCVVNTLDFRCAGFFEKKSDKNLFHSKKELLESL